MTLCDRCKANESEENRLLSEIAHSQNRSLQDILKQHENAQSSLMDMARRSADRRFEEQVQRRADSEQELKRYEEQLAQEIIDRILDRQDPQEIAEKVVSDEQREQLEQDVRDIRYGDDEMNAQDIERGLQQYVQRGDLEIREGKIIITPKGARKLANWVLTRILRNISGNHPGPHTSEITGYGVEQAFSSRRYESGDRYDRIDFERTFLSALESRHAVGTDIRLKPEDFYIFEEIHRSRMVAGVIVDVSGSMAGQKANAALDTALALSELVRREPKDSLKIYSFSEQAREIPYYDLVNTVFHGGSTDICAALRAFRNGVFHEKGDKQAYLITDTEPNMECLEYVGFDRAAAGLVQEALRYREAGITLNIVMLDRTPKLVELASLLAKQNMGRVFFTSPQDMGQMVIEDYLAGRMKTVGV